MIDYKELKHEIKRIEAEIFAITGKNNEIYNHWADDEDKRNRVIELLRRRNFIVEDMFFAVSKDEIERLKAVNNKLKNLTKSTRKKLGKMVMKTLYECHQGEEFVVEGSLSHVYNGEDSVLKLDEDGKYGSNFTLIIKVLTELYIALQKAEIFVLKIDSLQFRHDNRKNYTEKLSRIMESLCAPFRETK